MMEKKGEDGEIKNEVHMTIKNLLGRGGFCKVKESDVIVWRPGPEDENGVPEKIWGIQ